jgi:hypothetical protein
MFYTVVFSLIPWSFLHNSQYFPVLRECKDAFGGRPLCVSWAREPAEKGRQQPDFAVHLLFASPTRTYTGGRGGVSSAFGQAGTLEGARPLCLLLCCCCWRSSLTATRQA